MKFDNSKIENIHHLRRKKINLESILVGGKYDGLTIKEVIDKDLEYIDYLETISSDWTWPVLVYWKSKKHRQIAIEKSKSVEKKYRGMGLESIFKFGKYKGSTVREVLKINPSYVDWCKETLKLKFTV